MTIFDNFRSKSIDEMTDWLKEHCSFDYAPWWKWWDKDHCNKCEPETAYVEAFGRECEYAWCELNGKCKFFPNINDMPDEKQIIKMWLESEV